MQLYTPPQLAYILRNNSQTCVEQNGLQTELFLFKPQSTKNCSLYIRLEENERYNSICLSSSTKRVDSNKHFIMLQQYLSHKHTTTLFPTIINKLY